MYKIIGADGNEYGPITTEQLRQWLAEGRVNAQTKVPPSYVKNGEIVLNVSSGATRKLTIDNEWVQFTARFNGSSQEVAVPMATVTLLVSAVTRLLNWSSTRTVTAGVIG